MGEVGFISRHTGRASLADMNGKPAVQPTITKSRYPRTFVVTRLSFSWVRLSALCSADPRPPVALRQARAGRSTQHPIGRERWDPLNGPRQPRLSLSLYWPSVAQNWLPPTATPESLEAPVGTMCCEESRKLYGEVEEASRRTKGV